jgi:uncharacterized protein
VRCEPLRLFSRGWARSLVEGLVFLGETSRLGLVRLQNTFEVAAPVETAWRLLTDVPSVIPCMPGAELVEVVDESIWRASLRVKLGPITMQFAVDVSRVENDEAGGRVVLVARARESRGKGSAQATIESLLTTAGTGTRVDVITDLALQGAVAQYGRGIVADVAARLTGQFASCIAAKLSELPSAGDTPAPPAVTAPIGGVRLFLWALLRRLRRGATTRR